MVAEYVRHLANTLFPKMGLMIFFTIYVAAFFIVFSPSRKKFYDVFSKTALDLQPELGEKNHE